MKKRKYLPHLIAGVSAVLFLLVILNLPSMRLFIIDWKIALLFGFGFLSYKIFRWSESLFGELPP